MAAARLPLVRSRDFATGTEFGDDPGPYGHSHPSGTWVAQSTMTAEDNDGPLSGYRIVDLTTSMSGPLATLILADQGADVIKIEAPGGDIMRRVGPGRGGMSGCFANLNRGKQSIVIDLRNNGGVEMLRRLLQKADVFVHNLRVGAPERLGIGPSDICKELPRLIYVAISGFGPETSRATDPAYDHLIQAVSGIAARQADKGGVPELVRQGVVDKATGYSVAQAVTAALLRRERTGKGELVQIGMLDVAINFLWPDGMANYTCLEDDISQYGDMSGSFRLTPTLDGFVALNTITDRQFRSLIEAVGMEFDARLATVEGRGRYGGDAMREVRRRLSTVATDAIVLRMRRYGVPCAPVVGLEDVRTSQMVVEAGVLRELEHPVLGRIVQPRPAPRMRGVDEIVRRPAPRLGEDTDAILRGLHLGDEEIRTLRDGGAVA